MRVNSEIQLYRVSSEVYWLSWFKSLETCQCVSMFPWIAWNGSPLWANCWGGFASCSGPFFDWQVLFWSLISSCTPHAWLHVSRSLGQNPLGTHRWREGLGRPYSKIKLDHILNLEVGMPLHCMMQRYHCVVPPGHGIVSILYAHLQFQLLSVVASVHIPVSQL